jgi:DNA (cytosine-5)-methyltransferase 1
VKQLYIPLANELIVDNFAGGGGASLGIEMAFKRNVDIAINHDCEALAMHEANHPQTKHYCEDVWAVDPVKVTGGKPVGLAWFSPDCKHFSKAKGGKPVEKKIRGLAWVVVKWAKLVSPRVIMLENVEEFQDWGPLRADGTPCPIRKGMTFRRWKKQLENLGYKVECRQLRACDYGTPTIRKRLFVIARRDGLPIVWPEPTHGKGLKPWRTAAECIDWTLTCPSIFERKKPLAEATMRRIAKGIFRYVINAKEPFIVTYYGDKGKDDFRGQPINEPLRTQTTENRHAVVMPFLTEHANASQQRNFSADEPLRTQCAQVKGGHFALVSPTLIQTGYGERPGQSPRVPGLHKPLGTVVAGGSKHALVSAFLAQHNGGMVGHDARKPISTITQRGTQQQVVAAHMINLKGSTGRMAAADAPVQTITAGGNHIGEVRAFLVKYYGTDQDPQLREPLHTVTTKDRFGLVTVQGEDYYIADIGMRMLQPRELYRAQGFPDTYRIDIEANGKPLTKTAQVRMCGNSVNPQLSRALVLANFKHEFGYQEGVA